VLNFGDMGTDAAFERLFRTVLLKGAFVASQLTGVRVPRRFRIDIVGGDRPGRYDDVADAARALWREDRLFYARIDLAVGEIAGERARAIAIVLPARPCAFDETWNTPRGYGPFRLVRWDAIDASGERPAEI
jgi:hypothetical protein